MSDQLNVHRPATESGEQMFDAGKFEKEFQEGLREIDQGIERSGILLRRVREENKRLAEIVKGIDSIGK